MYSMNAMLRFSGAQKRDPTIEEWLSKTDALLEGAGKNMRHVKLKPGREPDSIAIGALIDASYLDVKTRLRAE
jgi:hypothetical protein